MKLFALGDSHFRLDKPECRGEEDWYKVVCKKLAWIREVTSHYTENRHILHAGDLFHKAKSEPRLERLLLYALQDFCIHIAPGNHDLPYGRIDQIDHSSLGVLDAARLVNVAQDFIETGEEDIRIDTYPWKMEKGFCIGDVGSCDCNIALAHRGFWFKSPPYHYEGKDEDRVERAEDIWDEYNIVVTGHYHVPFCYKTKDLLWVNTGPTFVQSWAEREVKEGMWVIDTDALTAEFIEDPKQPVLVQTTHLEKKQRDERVDKFVSSLSSAKEVEVQLDFVHTLRDMMEDGVPNSVIREIESALEEAQ